MSKVKWYENVDYESLKRYIQNNLMNMTTSFIAIGYYLKQVRDRGLYKEDGLTDIWQFADMQYGISRSTASRWMKMNDRFSADGNSPVLADQYKDFGKSQLQEMLYLPEEQIEEITADMTVQGIRKVRKPDPEIDPPIDPPVELRKPTELEKSYLDLAAKQMIHSLHDWMLEDFENRVLNVTKSPELLKEKIGLLNRTWYFSVPDGVAHINLFDDYVQLWDSENKCMGDFEWFYMAAAIQSMWNVVELEEVQKERCATSHADNPEKDPEPETKDIFETSSCAHKPEYRCSLTDEQEVVQDPDKEVTDLDIARKICERQNDLVSRAKQFINPDDYHFRSEQIKLAAIAAYICDLENIMDPVSIDEPQAQPVLPIMTNDKMRGEFIDAYATWPIWIETKETGEKYHRYDFDNGMSFVVKTYHGMMFDSSQDVDLDWKDRFTEQDGAEEYYLLKGGFFHDSKCNRSELINTLKAMRMEKR